MSRENVEVAATDSAMRVPPTERRTWEDRIAIRFPGTFRKMARLYWRVFRALRPGHPLRRAIFKRLMRRSYGAFNRNDLGALLPLYHPDCVWDWSRFEGWPEESVFLGPEGLRRGWLVFREAWGDFRVEPSDLRDLGDRQWRRATCVPSAGPAASTSK